MMTQNNTMYYPSSYLPQYQGNIGAYPQGYAPPIAVNGYYPQQQPIPNANNSAYSAFIPQPYTPGMVSPIQVENSNGMTRQIFANQIQQVPHMQGGTMINQGGFNPVTGYTTQSGGYNVNNPYYSQNNMVPPIPPNINNGYNKLRTGPGENPYMSPGYGYVQGYSYNQFDTYMQEILYNENPSETGFNVEEMLADIILSDQEREKINHNRNASFIVGRDYYGNPIFSGNKTAYQINQERQNEIQELRRRQQDHFVNIARIAAAYSGETTVDEDKVRKVFDPLPQQQTQTQAVKPFNYYESTEEEKKEYNRQIRLEQTFNISQRFDMFEDYERKAVATKQMLYDKIKESHDKALGVEPGQHYDLSQFLTEGYKLGLNIQQQEIRKANRNGQAKYHRNEYRAGIAQTTNTPVPITSKDDSFVHIEEMLKSVYERNKTNMNSVLITRGDNNYTTTAVNPEEEKHHVSFMQAVQEKKTIDDAKRGVD